MLPDYDKTLGVDLNANQEVIAKAGICFLKLYNPEHCCPANRRGHTCK